MNSRRDAQHATQPSAEHAPPGRPVCPSLFPTVSSFDVPLDVPRATADAPGHSGTGTRRSRALRPDDAATHRCGPASAALHCTWEHPTGARTPTPRTVTGTTSSRPPSTQKEHPLRRAIGTPPPNASTITTVTAAAATTVTAAAAPSAQHAPHEKRRAPPPGRACGTHKQRRGPHSQPRFGLRPQRLAVMAGCVAQRCHAVHARSPTRGPVAAYGPCGVHKARCEDPPGASHTHTPKRTDETPCDKA